VPVRNAAKDCSVWERRVGVVKSPQCVHLGSVEGCACRHVCSEPWSLALPNLLGRRSRQRHLISLPADAFGSIIRNIVWDSDGKSASSSKSSTAHRALAVLRSRARVPAIGSELVQYKAGQPRELSAALIPKLPNRQEIGIETSSLQRPIRKKQGTTTIDLWARSYFLSQLPDASMQEPRLKENQPA
jgi:hypothetical protein